MSLTIGTGPFGQASAGEFGANVPQPGHVMYFERSPRRIRLVLAGETVADSRDAHMLHESGALPQYYLPEADARREFLEPSPTAYTSPSRGAAQSWNLRVGDRVVADAARSYPSPPADAPAIAGYLVFRWDAIDEWYEEDEQIFVHPADPYHRIDVRESSRHVRVLLDGEVLAESHRPRMLFETGLPTRYYLPAEDVRADLLVDSDTTTKCAYKGEATYRSVQVGGELKRDLIWSYSDPHFEAERVRGYLSFFTERIDLEVDGEVQPRPRTAWSKRADVPEPTAD